jgi:hypothetical protein
LHICGIWLKINYYLLKRTIMSRQEIEVTCIHEDVNYKNDGVEIIESSNIIKEGMFAIIKKLHRNLPYELGVALLIQELKFADHNLHTVWVRHHPTYSPDTVGFLLEDFYQHFDVITQTEGESIRKSEIEDLQKLISHKEQAVQEYKDNPKKLQAEALHIYSKRIESPTTSKTVRTDNIARLLGQENAVEQINSIKSQADMFSDVAKIQADIIMKKVNELQTLMTKLTPFLVERYATTIASTKEAQDTIKEVNDGLSTLSLYTGEGVDVYDIKQGKNANQEVPLSLIQNRIICDVELAYFNDKQAAYLDVDNICEQFFDVMANNPKLVDQIFPTERCVCVAVIRESDIDYKDNLWNIIMNRQNKKSFLLIRNGENISAVFSPIGSHLAAKNLFPSKDVLDKCFLSRFDEMEITVDSLKYSDALSEVDKITLHYKRFLILLAGLQHRLNLLGQFYPENEGFEIFFPHFQNKYFNFIHDQDGTGMLADLKELSLDGYIAQQNNKLSKGSKIICQTFNMVSQEAAPYCWTYSWRRGTYSNSDALTRRPVNNVEIATVEQDKDGFYVRFPVSSGYSARTALAKVRIDESRNSDLEFLVLDNLSIDRLDNYISKRKYRQNYLKYIELFKGAKAYIQEFELENQKNIQYYLDAVQQIKDIDKSPVAVKELVMGVINFFAPKVNQASILSFLHKMLSSAANEKMRENLANVHFFKDEGFLIDCKAIAITVDRSGNSFIYVSLPKELELSALSSVEQDYWVYRCPIKTIKHGKLNIDKAETVSILDNVRDELVIHVIDDDLYEFYHGIGATARQTNISNGKGEKSYSKLFKSYQMKSDFLDEMEFSKEFIVALFSNSVNRDLVSKMQTRVKASINEFNANNNSIRLHNRDEEITLCLPFMIFKNQSVGAICLKDGIAWLNDLAERYNGNDFYLIDQNNLSQKVGVIKTNLYTNNPELLFTRVFDLGSGWNTFSSKNTLSSQYEHSVKLLSYVLHSSAIDLIKDDHFGRREEVNITTAVNYCVFDIDALITLTPSLDADIKNPHYIDNMPVIKGYRLEESVNKGASRISNKSHIYLGAEPYLSQYVEKLKEVIEHNFTKLSGNVLGEIRWDDFLNEYICSTGDFELFKKEMFSARFNENYEADVKQIESHIYGIVQEQK